MGSRIRLQLRKDKILLIIAINKKNQLRTLIDDQRIDKCYLEKLKGYI